VPVKKVLLLVVDALSHRIVVPAMRDGRLPNLAALAGEIAERAGRTAGSLNYLIFRGDTVYTARVPTLMSLLPGVPSRREVHGPSLLSLGDFVVATHPRTGATLSAPGGLAGGLDCPHSGDVWATARPGWEFALPRTSPNAGGSHGSLHVLVSLSPLIVAGAPPGVSVPRQARTVNIVPPALGVMGLSAERPVGAGHQPRED
jgi:hypothetical protein